MRPASIATSVCECDVCSTFHMENILKIMSNDIWPISTQIVTLRLGGPPVNVADSQILADNFAGKFI